MIHASGFICKCNRDLSFICKPCKLRYTRKFVCLVYYSHSNSEFRFDNYQEGLDYMEKLNSKRSVDEIKKGHTWNICEVF